MTDRPRWGHTRHGLPVHERTLDHLPRSNPVDRFNARLAVIITAAVGSMWCAYTFALFDLLSLPVAIRGGTATIVSWVAQTFLQLVLLSVIMVGQNVQAAASDARAARTFEDTERVLDLLRLDTEGGLKDLYDKLHAELTQEKPGG
jgi:hypothetical protein